MSPSQTPKILVVEDDPDILRLISLLLRGEGYKVLTAADGPTALAIAFSERPDMLVLDIVIPPPDGLEVCRRVRESRMYMPILFVTARKEQWDQVAGLATGGDHYIVKPFDTAYFIQLVRAALRREGAYRSEQAGQETIRIHDLELDLARCLLRRGSEEVHLTPAEFRIMAAMARASGRVFTRDQLQDLLWDPMSDETFSSRTIDMHICRLRSKIGDTSGRVLVTVRSLGYRLSL